MLPKSRHPEAVFGRRTLQLVLLFFLRSEGSAVLLQQKTDPSARLMSLV